MDSRYCLKRTSEVHSQEGPQPLPLVQSVCWKFFFFLLIPSSLFKTVQYSTSIPPARARASKLHSSIGRPTDSHCARPAQFPLYRRRARACLMHGTSDSCSSRPSTHAKNKGEERKTWNSCFYPTAPKSGTGRPVENLLDGVCRNCGKQWQNNTLLRLPLLKYTVINFTRNTDFIGACLNVCSSVPTSHPPVPYPATPFVVVLYIYIPNHILK